MSTLVIEKYDIELEYETDCLLIRHPDQPVRSLPLSRITKVVCMHNVRLTTQLLGQFYQRGIDFVVLNSRHAKHSFALHADTHQYALRRCQQYAWQLDPSLRFSLAKALCRHKFKTALRLVHNVQCSSLAAQLEMAIESVDHCQQEAQLRGIEGSAQKALFSHWRQQIPADWGFEKRIRRPPPDPINALLSFSYTLIHHEAIRQAKCYGLDPDLGFYHRLAYSRQSLACDLMEPLRPRIETWLVELVCKGMLNKRHFTKTSAEGCFLGKEGRLIFYPLFDEFLLKARKVLAANARWVVAQLKTQPAQWSEFEIVT